MEQQQSNSRRFQILSLDGGGLKGVFTASFLAQMEEARGKRVTEMFDLVAGTSTGGIIALGLGLGLKAKEVLSFYLQEADRIFPKHMLANAKHWLAVKHDAVGLEEALKKHFGDRRLGDSICPLLIPSYNPQARELHIFKTPHHKRLQIDYREKVVNVARATAAAPTYFSPYQCDAGVQLVDGGVWANNPVMLAVTEAVDFFQQPLSSIAALRIGTTTEAPAFGSASTTEIAKVRILDRITLGLGVKKRSEGGKLQMAAAVLDYMMHGQERSASSMAKHLLGDQRLHEVNPILAPGSVTLDELSVELVALGKTLYRQECSDLDTKLFFNHQPQPYQPCYVN